MDLLVLVAFIVALSVASALGWTVDSRDGADWAATSGGFRARPRCAGRRPRPARSR